MGHHVFTAALKLSAGKASGHLNGEPWVADRSLVDGIIAKIEAGDVKIDAPPEAVPFVVAQVRDQLAFLSGCTGHIRIDADLEWPEDSDPPAAPDPAPTGGVEREQATHPSSLVPA